jgi:hypothetical protein
VVRARLMAQSEQDEDGLDDTFDDFELAQPAVYAEVSGVLEQPLGDTARALGYFLSLTVWRVFQETYGRGVRTVSVDEILATTELLEFDGQLREDDPAGALETDDLITMEQPALMRFIHEQIQSALDAQDDEIDLDHLQAVYRMLMIELLSLSYAVRAPAGFPLSKAEAQA